MKQTIAHKLIFISLLICLVSSCQRGPRYTYDDYVTALKQMKEQISPASEEIKFQFNENDQRPSSEEIRRLAQRLANRSFDFHRKPSATLQHSADQREYTLQITEKRINKLTYDTTVIKVYLNFANQPMVQIHSYQQGLKFQQPLPKLEAQRRKEFINFLKQK